MEQSRFYRLLYGKSLQNFNLILNRTISIFIRVVSFVKSFITLYNYISE